MLLFLLFNLKYLPSKTKADDDAAFIRSCETERLSSSTLYLLARSVHDMKSFLGLPRAETFSW